MARGTPRFFLVVGGLVVLCLLQLSQIVGLVALVVAGDIGECAIEIFGALFPSSATSCFVSIGEPVGLAVGYGLGALAIALRPRTFGPLVAVLTGFLAVRAVAEVLPLDDPFTSVTLQLSLLAAIPFLVYVPSGPAANAWARLAWALALAAFVGLTVFDTIGSGILRVAPPGPQVACLVAGVTVLVAGLISGRPGRAAEPANMIRPA